MDIRFSGQNLDVTAGMKEHANEKLFKLERYAPRLVEAHVILKKEKYIYIAEATLLAKNFRAYGEGRVKDNIYAAIDQACDRISTQLKKYREKVKDHHKDQHGPQAEPMKVKTAETIQRELDENDEDASLEPQASFGEDDLEPEIVRMPSFAVKPMSVEEASMQLRLSRDHFVVFLNANSKNVNVLFKKDDGKHGLIEPQF